MYIIFVYFNHIFVMWLVLEQVETVLCGDGKLECPVDTTCCETEDGQWACCPLPRVWVQFRYSNMCRHAVFFTVGEACLNKYVFIYNTLIEKVTVKTLLQFFLFQIHPVILFLLIKESNKNRWKKLPFPKFSLAFFSLSYAFPLGCMLWW